QEEASCDHEQHGLLRPSSGSESCSVGWLDRAGTAFIDLHHSGVFQNGDPGVSGLAVFLTGTNEAGQTIDLTTTTAFDGSYSFSGTRLRRMTSRRPPEPGMTSCSG